jgi:late competence protein required for DNA uptake (superfamily II DNA/RNA helicase)
MPEEIQTKPEEKKKTKQKETSQRPTNCVKCNRRLQRKAWYYRNGGYYCSKRCWKLSSKELSKKKEKGEEVKGT